MAEVPCTNFAGIGGKIKATTIGHLPGLCNAFFHPKAPANIIPFAVLKELGSEMRYFTNLQAAQRHSPLLHHSSKNVRIQSDRQWSRCLNISCDASATQIK